MRIEFLLLWYPDLLLCKICISIVNSVGEGVKENKVERSYIQFFFNYKLEDNLHEHTSYFELFCLWPKYKNFPTSVVCLKTSLHDSCFGTVRLNFGLHTHFVV